jgi:hypothetical protein
MIRLLSTVSLAALLLAACTPEAAEPVAADAVAETASAETAPPAAPEGFQLSYMLENETYTVQSEIDPAILAFDPALAWRLWTANKAALDALVAQARADKAASDADPEAFGFMGYSLSLTQKAALVLEDVISLADTTDTYTGGAHPNYFLGGETYRKGEEAPLPLATFIADEAAFNDLVIKALVAAKLANGFDTDAGAIESGLREILVPSPEYPEIYKGKVQLAPSSEPGKIGGLTVVFSPYDVGAYAEGPYTVTLTAADLAPILTADWSARFGGEPVVTEEAPVTEP